MPLRLRSAAAIGRAGNVTLRLQNVPWDQALDIVLRTKGLDKRQEGNVIYVAPAEELAAREKALKTMKPGDIVLLTKALAVEGTSIIAREFPSELRREGSLRRSQGFLSALPLRGGS